MKNRFSKHFRNSQKPLLMACLSLFILSTPALACRKIKDDVQNRLFIVRYLEVNLNERCQLSYSLKDGDGHLNFKQVNYSQLTTPDNLDVKFDNSDPNISRFTIVSKEIGNSKFSFSEDILYWDNQRFSFSINYEITTVAGPSGTAKRSSKKQN